MVAQKAQGLTIHTYYETIGKMNPEPGVWGCEGLPMPQKQQLPSEDKKTKKISNLIQTRPTDKKAGKKRNKELRKYFMPKTML